MGLGPIVQATSTKGDRFHVEGGWRSWFHSGDAPDDETSPELVGPPPWADDPGAEPDVSPELRKTRALLASVEELRALLAPLTEEERRRVLDLARRLARHEEGS